MGKCANISPYIRRPLVIYDLATAPFWISLYCTWGKFSFLFYQCGICFYSFILPPLHISPYSVLSLFISLGIEDWMIYRGPGFLAVVWFGSTPAPSPVSNLTLSVFKGCRCSSLLTGKEGGEGVGVEPNPTIARKLGPLSIVQSSLFPRLLSFTYSTFSPAGILYVSNRSFFFFFSFSFSYIAFSSCMTFYLA